ncbi:MAG TPA: hypothetical protein VF665_15460 [Longimicrobium sp.]|jgi:hypothetical protein|uniref:hypothetical protein n=1 Tax=Longimicrobium sp. TaxID=2029185 RepID=UPI002EDA6F36
MLRSRQSADTAYLNAITYPTNELRDRGVFEAALAIAGDKSASVPARVFANRVLYWALLPSAGVDYNTLVDIDGDGRDKCIRYGQSFHYSVKTTSELPSDYREQSYRVTWAATRDLTEPAPVRQSAACVAVVARPRSGEF